MKTPAAIVLRLIAAVISLAVSFQMIVFLIMAGEGPPPGSFIESVSELFERPRGVYTIAAVTATAMLVWFVLRPRKMEKLDFAVIAAPAVGLVGLFVFILLFALTQRVFFPHTI